MTGSAQVGCSVSRTSGLLAVGITRARPRPPLIGPGMSGPAARWSRSDEHDPGKEADAVPARYGF